MMPLKEQTHFKKPLEGMVDDVKEGDLVRVFLEKSDYVGYVWCFEDRGRIQPVFPEDVDVILAGLSPVGYTRFPGDSIVINRGTRPGFIFIGPYPIPRDVPDLVYKRGPTFGEKIQFVGINLGTKTMGNEHVKGYEVIERAEPVSEED
jgi:hypothetical protein